MKFSHVNKYRTGEYNHKTGNVYDSSVGTLKKPDDAVKEILRRNKTLELYSVFNFPQDEKDAQRVWKYDTLKSCTGKMIQLYEKKYAEVQKWGNTSEQECCRLSYKSAAEAHYDTDRNGNAVLLLSGVDASEVVSDSVDLFLKKSLRCYVKEGNGYLYVPDLLKELLTVLVTDYRDADGKYDAQGLKDSLAAIEQHAKVAMKAVYMDYSRKDKKNDLVKALVNQDVHVRPARIGGDIMLDWVYGRRDKKNSGLLDDFLKRFAAADKDGQGQELLKLQSYITLFVSGENELRDVSELTAVGSAFSGALLSEKEACLEPGLVKNIRDLETDQSTLFSLEGQEKAANKEEQKTLEEEIDRVKREIGRKKQAIRKDLKDVLWERFRHAKEVLNRTGDQSGVMWVTILMDDTLLLLDEHFNWDQNRLSQRYLCRALWKRLLSFLSGKYVELGKGVYNFVLPEDLDALTGTVSLGKVQKEFSDEITGFDYEYIKAREDVTRNVSRYLAFSVNNFYRSVCPDSFRSQKDKEDVFGVRDLKALPMDDQSLYMDAGRRVLRYFGGISNWESFQYRSDENRPDEKNIRNLIAASKDLIAGLRNESFHFLGSFVPNVSKESLKLVQEMAEKEISEEGHYIGEKYFSNNTAMFYETKSITNLMSSIYQGEKTRKAQIPAFERVIARGNLQQSLPMLNITEENLRAGQIRFDSSDKEDQKKNQDFLSSLYFILKEIYYYDFLQREDVYARFSDALNHTKTLTEKEKRALDNFRIMFEDTDGKIQNNGDQRDKLGRLCQAFLTEYGMQNTKIRKQKNLRSVKLKDQESFKHYKMILYKTILGAFCSYLSENTKFAFLKTPVFDEERHKSSEITLKSWTGSDMFGDLKKALTDENGKVRLLSWYLAGHYMNPRFLNELVGKFEKYEAFLDDVSAREKTATGKTSFVAESENLKDVIRMLNLVKLSSEHFSENLSDYFYDASDYAAMLARYVDFGGEDEESLAAFCSKTIPSANGPVSVGIYHDGTNPILNRNLIRASMYGGDALPDVWKKVNYNEIKDYVAAADKLTEYYKTGICRGKQSAAYLSDFHKLKDRVELTDVSIINEMICRLYSELIVLFEMRERDLMYFQLGMHYSRLFHGKADEESIAMDMNSLSDGKMTIEAGAVLYQIVAMYQPGLKIYTKDGKRSSGFTGSKVTKFAEMYGNEEYYRGLYLFEMTECHEAISDLRNYIDHFKYFASHDKSLMELYWETYDKAMKYSINYRNSTFWRMDNTLGEYFVKGNLKIVKTGEDEDGKSLSGIDYEDKFLKSAKRTYVYMEEDRNGKELVKKKIDLHAHGEVFLDEVYQALRFKK